MNSKSTILFLEDKSVGYRPRTKQNASADATIAIAVDFYSRGEILTKKCVLEQGKKYIPIDFNNREITQERVDKIVRMLNEASAKILNIAGNGIYTMKGKATQKECDDFVFELLSQVFNHPQLQAKIEVIRSGGQTGFDEAGIKAAIKLGIDAVVLAPKGWKYRLEDGTDVCDEENFKKRFLVLTSQ